MPGQLRRPVRGKSVGSRRHRLLYGLASKQVQGPAASWVRHKPLGPEEVNVTTLKPPNVTLEPAKPRVDALLTQTSPTGTGAVDKAGNAVDRSGAVGWADTAGRSCCRGSTKWWHSRYPDEVGHVSVSIERNVRGGGWVDSRCEPGNARRRKGLRLPDNAQDDQRDARNMK